MKRFAISMIAVLVAVIGFSFTVDNFKGSNYAACDDQDQSVYLWFRVAQGKTCNTLTINDVILPLADGASDAIITDDALPLKAVDNPFGCQDETVEACAIGFTNLVSNFTKVEIPVGSGIYYWKPIQLNPVCCRTYTDQ